ncbi:MAG: calcium-translocating P-type ATPase, SERCA-type [Syntrophomonas sp.]
MTNNTWCSIDIEEVLEKLKSNRDQGLSAYEVKHRQEIYHNSIESDKGNNAIKMFLAQFTDTMVLVLLGATVISGMIGAMADAITIMAIVVLNAILGFIQEYKAERSLEEIKKLTSPFTLVVREGKRVKVSTAELVPGDIVILETGDRVPADLRLIESYSLEAEESLLTGESLPVEKKAINILDARTHLAEQVNMAFMGTSISRGRAKAVVVATGMDTVMGQIANMMKNTERSMTPLQTRLDQLGKILIIICLTVCAVVSIMGIWRGEPVLVMLMAGISLAVAAIPEGLPAIVTVVLALGVQRMAKRNAIIRKLPAVETLGCTTVICSDKTGTITQNKMTARRMATSDIEIDIEGDGYNPQGRFFHLQRVINPLNDPACKRIMEIAFNCNNSQIEKTGGVYKIQGDPTEAALMVMAQKSGINEGYLRIREIPFDSERKLMSAVVEVGGEQWVLVKGALDVLINSCTSLLTRDKTRVLGNRDKERFYNLQEKWAHEALRVLGFAFRKLQPGEALTLNDAEIESKLTLLGICGIMDPPRPGVEKSVADCLQAGIIPVMITGDHPATAQAIASSVGIADNPQVTTGIEIDRLSDHELYKIAVKERVFARVSPEHKNRIVKVLKRQQHVVAMTGDGVNDAPALKAADIGIAMGISGTEVSREASSMVLADDNFSTIVEAVYEGRAIYDNIRKFIRYLLGCNIGEVLVMFLASLLGMPLPLLPIQILWVNLVTDGLPAMALGVEPPEPGIMKRSPRPRSEGIFARNLGWTVLGRGVFIAVATLLAFILGMLYARLNALDQLLVARSMAFTTLVMAQLFYVFECRSEVYSPFELGFSKNIYLLLAVSLSITMHLFALYLPFLQNIFKTVALNWHLWLIIIVLSGSRLILKYILYTWTRILDFRWNYAKINA